jgi:hypothetical protein
MERQGIPLSGVVEAGRGDCDGDDRVDAGCKDPGVVCLSGLDFLDRGHLKHGMAMEMDVAVVGKALGA